MNRIAGKYKVLRRLGVGATGEVFRVEHTDLGVHYALKILNQEISSDNRFIELFKREAEVLQRFSHPGITQLRDFGKTEDDRYYMAMDFCDGITLKEVLERDGPYSVRGALRVMIKILRVLEFAHENGIIHRDIKPMNIMQENTENDAEFIRILDFGTAFVRERIEQNEDQQQAHSETLGTPCYMSPEQAAGELELDHRVDIYSCGIVLYELLTGEIPFEGNTLVQTLLMQITQSPPPFASRYGISQAIEDLVFRALEKRKNKRYQNARHFRQACEDALRRVENERGRRSEQVITLTPNMVLPEKHQKETTRILCLDDNEMILNILKHVLEKEGYEVLTASDFEEVHDYLFNQSVDLLVSDINMPGMSGTKICRMLKENMESLKIILFSNIPERELEKHSQLNNADGWIWKGTKPADWLAEIQTVLDA